MVTLSNSYLSLRIIPYGARITSLKLADGTETVLGLPSDEAFREDEAYLGAVCGRFANRLRAFELDGVRYVPSANEGAKALHGGPHGFSHRVWEVLHESPTEAVFELVSADGDQGFPGRLTTRLRASLEDRSAVFRFEAETTAPTPVNLTLHPYFRFSGADAMDHHLRLAAREVLELNDDQLPTGHRILLDGGALDLRTGGALRRRIAERPGGLDHCYVTPGGCEAVLAEPQSQNELRVLSDAPMVQVYTGGALGAPHGAFAGVAIEPQSAPDAPNQPHLGETILRPGRLYQREIRYAFRGPGVN